MTRLAPAVLELRIVATATLTVGAALSLVVLVGGDRRDLRALSLSFAVCAAVLWGVWGARTVRTAIRLALPARAPWSLEDTAAAVSRVVVAQVLPLWALALTGGLAAARETASGPAITAGALVGVGLTALLAAHRIRRAERRLGRRILRRPHWGAPLGRRSLFLEPQTLSGHPGGRRAAPWPEHRPPARAQASAIELDPSNPVARHPVGVRAPGAGLRLSPRLRDPRRRSDS
jgi:hypothetical protein